MAIEDIRDAMVIRESGIFLLTDKNGNVPNGNESGLGLYQSDTRFLSAYELRCLTAPLVMLLSSAPHGYASEQVLTNPGMTLPDGRSVPRETVEVRRNRLIDGVVRETLEVTNFNHFAVSLAFEYRFAADFADIFDVRGLHPAQRGTMDASRQSAHELRFGYVGLDGWRRTTIVTFEQPADAASAASAASGTPAVFSFSLGPRERRTLTLTIGLESGPVALPDGFRVASPKPPDARRLAAEYRVWRDGGTRISTSNKIFNAVLDQSLSDVRTLWNESESGGYLSAGTPWFDTLFGRDSLIASWQLLAYHPSIARATLTALAAYQGHDVNERRDEQPGKILHELRSGEMARTGEVPFARYYGSIDSTPLFLVLAAEYWRWTGDRRFLRSIEPNLMGCLNWIHASGDRDQDGYIEYQRESENGLLNQGWKDSGEAIVHADGRLAQPAIALAEVQGYVYAGLTGLAEIARALRKPKLEAACVREAEQLRGRFNRDFWMPGGQSYALALDGEKQCVESITSNAGHTLFAGIATQGHGAAVAARLMQPDTFSGWGIRTLSNLSPRFNPMGYHVGSVWPHDNSIVAAGFKRYGQEPALTSLATAMYDAARAMEYYRLPELFCGTVRSADAPPVPYPVACRPQAWAAGTMPSILASLLGLCPDAERGQLSVVRPQLPYWLERVEVQNLRVGAGTASLLFELKGHRTQVTVQTTAGNLRVTVVPHWPR